MNDTVSHYLKRISISILEGKTKNDVFLYGYYFKLMLRQVKKKKKSRSFTSHACCTAQDSLALSPQIDKLL